MSFYVLARAMREALYLTYFDVRTLPYIQTTLEILSVPTALLFGWLLARYSVEKILITVVLVVAGGLAVIWPQLAHPSSPLHMKAAVAGFYLWTALGSFLLGSGFWILTCERFEASAAERLFGLIAAGGTLGAMLAGNSLPWLQQVLDRNSLMAGLIGLVILFAIFQQFLPRLEVEPTSQEKSAPISEGLVLLWRSQHLRTMWMIVIVVAAASTVLHYQFMEAVQARFQTAEGLSNFFGTFYGWVGVIGLLINFVLVSHILTFAGVAWALAALPLVLLFGSVGMLFVPSLALITAVRGADGSLRYSLYRASIEVLFVPVRALQRRRTLTLIDSVTDFLGEGLGAAVIILCVTILGLSSRYLSAFLIAAAITLLFLSRRMGRRYLSTLAEHGDQP
jgi:AAA family ATP:ADP antiporter